MRAFPPSVRRRQGARHDLEEVKRHYGYTMGLMPTQHGITRGETIYFFDPAGNLNDRFPTVMT